MIKYYVLGFAFNIDRNDVLLIKKTHPDWQAGKLNGIGGLMEFNEIDFKAMNREFYEETGIKFNDPEYVVWDQYMILQSKFYQVYCFRCFTNLIYEAKQTTEETPLIMPISEIKMNNDFVPGVPGLIDLALQPTISGRILYAN